MGEYGREQRNQLSRAIANNETGSRQLKGFVDNRPQSIVQFCMNEMMCNNSRVVQRVQLENIEFPSTDDVQAIGTTIHSLIGRDYVLNGAMPLHHGVKKFGMIVPSGHKTDLGMESNGTPNRFGEIKPVSCQNAGSQRVDLIRQLNPGLAQINDVAWANAVNIPLAMLDPNAHLVGQASTPNDHVQVRQDVNLNGLYLYDGA